MSLFGKYKIEIFFGIAIVFVYFATRLYNLTSLPIFTDEAIYIRWAQIAANDANWRFISLTDGKQPLFIWLMMPLMKLPLDPLFLGRLVSVGAGFGTVVGLFFLGWELFKSRWVGIIASLTYVLYPFALVLDRMALYDSLVGTFFVWSLYVSILLIRKIRLDLALILSFIIGGGILTKSSGFFSLALLPFTLVLFDFKQKSKYKDLLRWCFYAVLVGVISYIYYSILRLSPYFHIIDEKNTIFVYPLKEWLQHPFLFLVDNTKWLSFWLVTYLTIPFSLVIAASLFFRKKYGRELVVLFLFFIAPFIYLAFFGKTLYPRYLLFMSLPLLVIGAYSFYSLIKKIKNKLVLCGIFLIVYGFMAYSDFLILTDFAKAPIPQSDVNQYYLSWPSGVGVKETVDFINEKSKTEKIFVATEGTFGLMPYGLEIYLVNNPNVTIKGYWPIDDTPPEDALLLSKTMPVYFFFYQNCVYCQGVGGVPATWKVEKVLHFQKSPTNDVNLYKLLP